MNLRQFVTSRLVRLTGLPFRSLFCGCFIFACFASATHAQNLGSDEPVSQDLAPAPPSLGAAAVVEQPPAVLQLQRSTYLAAEAALEKGQIANYRKHLNNLEGYPLRPYLEYSELRRRLYLFPYEDVDKFLQQNANTYLGDAMRGRWLHTLAKHKHWQDYLRYFPADENSAELRCHYLWARVKTGDEAALKEVEPLWNVGHSQPDACDPLFTKWMDAGLLTADAAWQRFSKAMNAGNQSLAKYVAKRMPDDMKNLADLYLEVNRFPERIKNRERFAADTAQINEIIFNGVQRLARSKPLEALTVWELYDAQRLFPNQGRAETIEYLIIQLAKTGEIARAQSLLHQTKQIANVDLIEWLARDALRHEDWQRVYDSIQLLPPKEQDEDRWLYWRARALEHLKIEDPNYPSAEQILAGLALTRSFYGFLAADLLGWDYTLVDRPVNTSAERMTAVARHAGIARTRELMELGQLNNARREWWYATRAMESEDLLAAGKLAEKWGWHRQGIQAMIEAQYWDDLQVRFPLAYREQFTSAAESINVDPPLLFAIARQESAFAADARSSSGAMGLMQLMPATAKQTASQMGVKHQTWDLVDPAHNIKLGSRYLHQLLTQFGGNRILAAAAYNAGPYRVKRWLSENEKPLPYDVWIETIPFRETRGYVQNVLSFSVIYGYRLGHQISLLTENELNHTFQAAK